MTGRCKQWLSHWGTAAIGGLASGIVAGALFAMAGGHRDASANHAEDGFEKGTLAITPLDKWNGRALHDAAEDSDSRSWSYWADCVMAGTGLGRLPDGVSLSECVEIMTMLDPEATARLLLDGGGSSLLSDSVVQAFASVACRAVGSEYAESAISGLGSQRLRRVAREAILQELYANDPAAAFDYALQSDDGHLVSHLMEYWTIDDHAAALESIGRTSYEQKTQWLHMAMNKLGQFHPAAALDWLAGAALPRGETERLAATVISGSLVRDPKLAAEAFDQGMFPMSKGGNSLAGSIAAAWARQDFHEAREWASSIEGASASQAAEIALIQSGPDPVETLDVAVAVKGGESRIRALRTWFENKVLSDPIATLNAVSDLETPFARGMVVDAAIGSIESGRVDLAMVGRLLSDRDIVPLIVSLHADQRRLLDKLLSGAE